jgi:ABC-type glutathione transport system ATPase component
MLSSRSTQVARFHAKNSNPHQPVVESSMRTSDGSTPVLRVEDPCKHFPVRRGALQRVSGHVDAVDGVSFEIHAGETLRLVGESSCGKSTVGKTVLRLLEPTSGRIWLGDTEVTRLHDEGGREHRRQAQMVFQDPYSLLNPRMRRSRRALRRHPAADQRSLARTRVALPAGRPVQHRDGTRSAGESRARSGVAQRLTACCYRNAGA